MGVSVEPMNAEGVMIDVWLADECVMCDMVDYNDMGSRVCE